MLTILSRQLIGYTVLQCIINPHKFQEPITDICPSWSEQPLDTFVSGWVYITGSYEGIMACNTIWWSNGHVFSFILSRRLYFKPIFTWMVGLLHFWIPCWVFLLQFNFRSNVGNVPRYGRSVTCFHPLTTDWCAGVFWSQYTPGFSRV